MRAVAIKNSYPQYIGGNEGISDTFKKIQKIKSFPVLSTSTSKETGIFLNQKLVENIIETPSIIFELEEIWEERKEWIEDGINLSKKSIEYAKLFAKISIVDNDIISPTLEIAESGIVAFTWRSKIGIVNIAFQNYGEATWAAYFAKNQRTFKGRFVPDQGLSQHERGIIKHISNV